MCRIQSQRVATGAFLFGFVLGQADKEKITVKEFASSRSNIAEAVVRNQALLPS